MTRRATRGGIYHWREHGIEAFLPPAESGSRALILGYKDGGERSCMEQLGFNPIGLDIRMYAGVGLLGDAHRLPLRDGVFDVVLSVQVLEHLHSPWIAIHEIARVLRPGGCFVGSVALLKPCHNSYFHMTHLGVKHLLEIAGMKAEKFDGAQGPVFSLADKLVPVGNRAFRLTVFGAVDRFIARARACAWARGNDENPDHPTTLFGEDPPLSYRTFDRLRWAPAVVFRARKKEIPGPPP